MAAVTRVVASDSFVLCGCDALLRRAERRAQRPQDPEHEATRHPFAYLPFGGGQRICLGSNFAMLEIQVLTAVLARRFEARLVAGHRPQFEFGGTLMVRNGLPMVITRR